MAMLTREMILEAEDLPRELVEVTEWGGSVYVRGLTGAERDALEAGIIEMHGAEAEIKLENTRARLCALSMVDESGRRVFDERDIPLLAQKSAVALQRIFRVAQRLSGLTVQDMEELAKN